MLYIDNIAVYFKSISEHLQHLHQVLACLHKAGLTLSLKKCNLIQKSLRFLCHIVSGKKKSVAAVKSFPVPQTSKDVQRFLGRAGWHHGFIPQFSEKAAPLHAKTKKGHLVLD